LLHSAFGGTCHCEQLKEHKIKKQEMFYFWARGRINALEIKPDTGTAQAKAVSSTWLLTVFLERFQ
jgi:hypothetical protein